tara:strand:+ start:1189 stop:2055 length:867 start_codon:yes stop_codon:yes gene_type:complete
MIQNKANKSEISIIMSVYNETFETIAVAVDSILKQTFRNFELLLVNDNPASIHTQKAIEAISKKDKRIKVIRNDRNRGLGYALNAAIQKSSADIIARMDTEDKSLPKRLAKQISFMKTHIDVDLLFTQWIDVNERDETVIRQPCKKDFINIRKSFFIKSLLMHPTLMARKKVFIDNPYPEMGRPEDIVLWFKLIRKEYVFDIIEEPLYMYRIDRINILQRCAKTKSSSRNLLPHLVRESKYYWSNIYFWLFFGRTIFEYLISRNLFIFNFTHARAVWLWKYFFESNKS